MKIKKVFILITFLAVSLFAGRAFASESSRNSNYIQSYQAQPYYVDTPRPQIQVSGPRPQVSHYSGTPVSPYVATPVVQYVDTPSRPYQPALPQLYGNQPEFANNNPQVFTPQVVATQPVSQIAVAPQPIAPAYQPVSPTIFNSNGTTTAQNTGVVSGTPNSSNTSGSSNSSNSNDNDSIFGNLFGTKKTTSFSNGVSDGGNVNTDANLKALVNSKGLAMGSDGLACGTNNGQYVVLYKNITNQALTNAAIRISLPDGVTPTQTNTGSYSERDNTLTYFIGSLAPNQEGQILVPVKTTGAVSGVARSEFVYTYPTQVQDMVVSYAFGNSSCNSTNNALGASAIGGSGGFFGGTLLGWLFLALLVSAFIYLVRFFLIRKDAHGAHGHAGAH